MAQSFEIENVISENTCEAFMNDVMEEKCLHECEINLGLQTQKNKIQKVKKKEMKKKIMKLYVQRTIWKSNGRTSLCWVFVFFMNDNKYVVVNLL